MESKKTYVLKPKQKLAFWPSVLTIAFVATVGASISFCWSNFSGQEYTAEFWLPQSYSLHSTSETMSEIIGKTHPNTTMWESSIQEYRRTFADAKHEVFVSSATEDVAYITTQGSFTYYARDVVGRRWGPWTMTMIKPGLVKIARPFQYKDPIMGSILSLTFGGMSLMLLQSLKLLAITVFALVRKKESVEV